MAQISGSTARQQPGLQLCFSGGSDVIDTRPFPANIRVVVRNLNKPEPDSDDRFSGHCTFQHDGELFDFPPGKPKLLDPAIAWWMFLFDTRSDTNKRGEETPRNYRDKMSTGAQGNSGISSHTTLWDAKLAALGWANDKRKAKRFENFEFKTVNLNEVVDNLDLAKLH